MVRQPPGVKVIIVSVCLVFGATEYHLNDMHECMNVEIGVLIL